MTVPYKLPRSRGDAVPSAVLIVSYQFYDTESKLENQASGRSHPQKSSYHEAERGDPF